MSVREISKLTGADIKSWTEPGAPGTPARSTRTFNIEVHWNVAFSLCNEVYNMMCFWTKHAGPLHSHLQRRGMIGHIETLSNRVSTSSMANSLLDRAQLARHDRSMY